MPMSTDRVEFKLDASAPKGTVFQDKDDQATRKAYHLAFGANMPTSAGIITVRCRPSQFARFLIFREQAGGRNSFKCLEARLVSEAPPDFIDVSKNPRADFRG